LIQIRAGKNLGLTKVFRFLRLFKVLRFLSFNVGLRTVARGTLDTRIQSKRRPTRRL